MAMSLVPMFLAHRFGSASAPGMVSCPGGALRVVDLFFERQIRHDNSPFSVMRPKERITGLDRNGNRSSLWMDSIFARKENALKVLNIQFRTRS